MPRKSADGTSTDRVTPAKQLDRFISDYSPRIAATARSAKKMRAMLPGAVVFVYDNYNALVIGFGPTECASDAICSIALYPRWVNLFFLDGATLPDPDKLLKGQGSRVRRIVLDAATGLDRPPVRALIAAAVRQSDVPFPRHRKGGMVIKSVARRRRARRIG